MEGFRISAGEAEPGHLGLRNPLRKVREGLSGSLLEECALKPGWRQCPEF